MKSIKKIEYYYPLPTHKFQVLCYTKLKGVFKHASRLCVIMIHVIIIFYFSYQNKLEKMKKEEEGQKLLNEQNVIENQRKTEIVQQ